MKMIKPHVELLTQQYDKLGIYEMVELAGRTSYKSEKNMSFDENGRSTTAEAFTNKLISYNHGAALEHATIYLTIPKTEKLYKGMVKLFKDHITASESVYKTLLSKGLKAERARDLLPCGIKTEFVMTGFIDDWDKMLKLRLAKGAHPDAQLIAHQISDILNDVIQD